MPLRFSKLGALLLFLGLAGCAQSEFAGSKASRRFEVGATSSIADSTSTSVSREENATKEVSVRSSEGYIGGIMEPTTSLERTADENNNSEGRVSAKTSVDMTTTTGSQSATTTTDTSSEVSTSTYTHTDRRQVDSNSRVVVETDTLTGTVQYASCGSVPHGGEISRRGYLNLQSMSCDAEYGTDTTRCQNGKFEEWSGNHDKETCEKPCGGVRVGGFCWYLSPNAAGNIAGYSCEDTCREHGGYHEATHSFAGAGGANSQCLQVLRALTGATIPSVLDERDSSQCQMGCVMNVQYVRHIGCATTAEAKNLITTRACACQR